MAYDELSYSKYELRHLMELCKKEIVFTGDMQPIKWFYCDKDKEYFIDILVNNNGIMT
jgi:hypothetical protein